jgi:hypothetical protein
VQFPGKHQPNSQAGFSGRNGLIYPCQSHFFHLKKAINPNATMAMNSSDAG